MPMKHVPAGASKESRRQVVSENISEMVHSGHPQKQAVAASLRSARVDLSRRKRKKKRKKRDGHEGY